MNQLRIGAFLNYFIIILQTLLGLLYTPYMLRIMGQSEYGLYSLVSSVIAYLTVLDLGFGNAIVRYTAKFRAEGKIKKQYEMFGTFLILYSIIGCIAFIIGSGLYFNINTMFSDTMTLKELERARIMMLIMVFNIAFTFPMSIFGSIMTAYERFVFPKVVNIIRIILNTTIMIALLELGYRALAMVVLATVFNVITLFINLCYCFYKLKIKILFGKFQWGFLKEVTLYSFWIFLNALMDRIYWSTGQFVLGTVSGTTAIAVYSVAIQLEHLYMQFSTALSSVLLPKVTSMVVRNNGSSEISNLFIRVGRIQNIIMVFILCGFIVFGKQFIILWAGREYSDAYQMTLCFFIAMYIPLIQNLGITILQARNQMKFRSMLCICMALFSLITQFILAKSWGGIGCAIAVSGALLLGQGLIINIYYHKCQNIAIGFFWREIIKMNIVPFIISVFAIIIIQFITINTWSTLITCIIIYIIIYLPFFYRFSTNEDEKKYITVALSKIKKK